jgi:hypothetical protein
MHMVNTCVIADDTTIGASIHEGTALVRSWELTSYRTGDVRWVYYCVGTVVTEGTTLMVCSGAL